MKKTSVLEVPTITEIPKEELEKLKKKVARANGRIIIIVHPYYDPYYVAKSPKYKNAIEKAINQSKTPVIVLEEQKKLKPGANRPAEMKKYLRKLRGQGNLIIPTGSRTAQAIGEEHSKLSNVRFFSKSPHKELTNLLENLRVKKVWVGGMLADVDPVMVLDYIKDYEMDRLPKKTEKAIKKASRKGKFSDRPFTTQCAGNLYFNLILSEKFKQVAWLPKAVRLKGGFTSPYPHPRERRKEIKRRAGRPKRRLAM